MNAKTIRYTVKRTVWDAICAYRGNRRIETFRDAFEAQEWIDARRSEGAIVDASGVY